MQEMLRAVLKQVHAALAEGDAAHGERLAKAISAAVRAERDLAELETMQASPPEEDEQQLRAELHRRIALFAEADVAGAPPEVLERIALTGSSE